MNDLFMVLEMIPVHVTIDSSHNFMAHVSHRTINTTIEVVMRLKDYTTMQTVKMV